MDLTPPPKDWVLIYSTTDRPDKQYIFAGFKESGKPSYTTKFDKIEKYANSADAYQAMKQLAETNEYIIEVKKLCVSQDSYYFI